MTAYESTKAKLVEKPRTWLITGVAGFIGCNLLEALLRLGQNVVGLDNFATGHRENLIQIRASVGNDCWKSFRFIEGDIQNLNTCQKAVADVDFVLHHAALGSVPRSVENPIRTDQNNIQGTLNMLVASRDAGVDRFIYAASSSTYGDHAGLPKVEDEIGKPLSPYAVTKYVNELYADVFANTYGLRSIGLRYFNVFGPYQDPDGAYAAVIPKWVAAILNNEPVRINGDGETSRDFCYVSNAVQANLLAAMAENSAGASQVYNIAVGARTSLNELLGLIQSELSARLPHLQFAPPERGDFRVGDVRHSMASIERARSQLGYEPSHTLAEGLSETMDWYVAHLVSP